MSIAIVTEQVTVPSAASTKFAARLSVSVIIPCYNEERFIGRALENLVDQYATEDYEIVVVDGLSTDRTRDVVKEFQTAHPGLAIKLLHNPARAIPHALNLGIAAARGEVIARMDAHTAPSAGYIRRCVEVLNEGNAAVVGMPCRVRPASETVSARAIALAVSHPFGVGDAKYRLGGDRKKRQEDVDTVAFACFRKSLWTKLGGFDEELLTNEDYDFNYRVRARGERVVLDYAAHCDYFARPTIRKLAAQYFRYGIWKARMLRRRPRSTKLRQLVAPAFVLSMVLLAVAVFINSSIWALLVAELAIYILTAFYFSYRATLQQRETVSVMLMVTLAFFAIHLSWGTSFLWGLITPTGKRQRVQK